MGRCHQLTHSSRTKPRNEEITQTVVGSPNPCISWHGSRITKLLPSQALITMVTLLVTYMEMTAPPREMAPVPLDVSVQIDREVLERKSYLALYRSVGEPLQWDQRLRMAEGDLDAFLIASSTHLFVLRRDGQAIGLCEFDGVGNSEIELTNFGLVPEAQGQKLGPYLLDRALRSVWSYAPRRVWLHTDTQDHPKAQSVYQRAGFRIYAQRVENFPD
jgi:ribosomal protein S18 acetylase RimI-like enzyme